MTWSDQNCLTEGAYFAMIFLLKECLKFSTISWYFVWFILGDMASLHYIDYVKLLFSLDQTVTQLSTALSLKMSSRSKINCGQLNTVEYALYHHSTAGHPPCNHWKVGHTLLNHRTAGHTLSNYQTVEHALSNHRTVKYAMSNRQTVGHSLSNHWTAVGHTVKPSDK